MELKWLEDLLALFEEKSVTAAATSRNVTQPAYSRRIRQLEEWLGVEIIDRSTKPVGIRPGGLALEAEVRDLVNRFYVLRNKVHEDQDRITFIVQHTLAISRFPGLIRQVKQSLPETSFRVVPADNDDCESLFLRDGELLLCYQNRHRQIDFTHATITRIKLGSDCLLPVASREMASRLGNLKSGMKLPLLTYPRGSFLADSLANSCMPDVIRDYRVELVCESAFSASLKEMVLGGMGIAWLAADMIDKELKQGDLISYEKTLGSAELEILLFCNNDTRSVAATKIFDIIASL